MPEGSFAILCENVRDWFARARDDDIVGVEIGEMKVIGREATDGRFAGTHESDERDIDQISSDDHASQLAHPTNNRTQFLQAGKDLESGLDYIVKRTCQFLFQPARPFAELGKSDGFQNGHGGLAHFFHHGADGTAGLVRAGAFFVEAFTDTTDWSQRNANVSDDFGQSNALGWADAADSRPRHLVYCQQFPRFSGR